MMRKLALAFVLSAAVASVGCNDDKDKHHANDGHDHSKDKKASTDGDKKGGDHANAITLGEKTVAGLKIKALQDEPIKAGGEGAFDLQITGYPAGAKPKAVRFWVGSESG